MADTEAVRVLRKEKHFGQRLVPGTIVPVAASDVPGLVERGVVERLAPAKAMNVDLSGPLTNAGGMPRLFRMNLEDE